MSSVPSWHDLQIFLAVFEGGSLSAAARMLQLTQPTVRSRIDALEKTLGAVLFTRSAAGLLPTEQARDIAAHAQAMERSSQALVRAASGREGSISGTVRISVSEIVAAVVLPPMLVKLSASQPELAFEVVASNASTDLTGQEADIALRMYDPTQSTLVCRRVGSIRLGFFAHLDYLDKRGTPKELADLMNFDFIGPDRSKYDFSVVNAAVPDIEQFKFAFRSDSHLVQLAALKAGAGIGVQQIQIGNSEPTVARVLPGLVVGELPCWLVMHEDMRRLLKVRATFDHLVDEFTAFCKAAG